MRLTFEQFRLLPSNSRVEELVLDAPFDFRRRFY